MGGAALRYLWLRMEPNFLDEMIAKRAAANPDFPAMVDAAAERNARLEALKAKLEAVVEGMPEVSDEDLVDEILARRGG